MDKAKRARTAETPKQPSLGLKLRAPYFYPDTSGICERLGVKFPGPTRHQPSRHQTKCRRNLRLRQDALEDRERRLQRDEKSRLRVRTQFRPWRAISGDDAGEPEPPRLRLAHRARIAGAPLDSRPRGRGQANQLLRSSGNAHRLCDLSLLARLPL